MSDSSDGAAPQGLAEKLLAPVKPRDLIARIPLAKLRIRMWPLADIDFDDPPVVLEFEVMGRREIWRRSALMGGAAKESTLYELDRSAK